MRFQECTFEFSRYAEIADGEKHRGTWAPSVACDSRALGEKTR